MATRSAVGLSLLLTLWACGASGPGHAGDGGTDARSDGGPSACGPSLKPYKGACLPILDDCPGQQVPVPGGGCKRIGLEEGTPVGPQRPCLPGWTTVAGGWCEPIMPASPCPEGRMEVIGQADCQPVGDCGIGKWGKVTLSASTVFVDKGATTAGDGSEAKPFTSIGAALKAAAAGAQIVIAEGEYVEDVIVEKPLTLEGRCPELVRIRGVGLDPAAVRLEAGGVRLRGLTISGPRAGIIVVSGRKDVIIEQAAIEGAKERGLWVGNSAEVTLRRVLISNCVRDGLLAHGARVTVERSTVRRTQQPSADAWGVGVNAAEDEPSTVAISDSVLLANASQGLVLLRSTATVERSLIAGTHKEVPDDQWTAGIRAGAKGVSAKLVVRDCVLAENRTHGLDLSNVDLTLERSVVRDTLPKGAGFNKGNGVGLALQGEHRDVVVRDSLLVGNHGANIWLGGAAMQIERSRLGVCRPNPGTGWGGFGVTAGPVEGSPVLLEVRRSLIESGEGAGIQLLGEGAAPSTLRISETRVTGGLEEGQVPGPGLVAAACEASITDSLFERTGYIAMMFVGAKATVDRTVARDTWPARDLLDQWAGYGIYVGPPGGPVQAPLPPSSLLLRDSVLAGNEGAGLQGSSATVTVERSRISGTRQVAATLGDGLVGYEAPGYGSSRLVVHDSLVEGSARAGLLLIGGAGVVERSLFRKNPLCVAVEEGAALDSKDLVCEQNQEDRISYGQGLKAAPPPMLPPAP